MARAAGVARESPRTARLLNLQGTGVVQRMRFSKQGEAVPAGEERDAEQVIDTENLTAFGLWIDELKRSDQLGYLTRISHALEEGHSRSEAIGRSLVRGALDRSSLPVPVRQGEPLRLENLPKSQWWRLFVDRDLWNDGPQGGAVRFDYEKSPGYYSSLMRAFDDLTGKPVGQKANKNFDWYEDLHRLMIRGVMREKSPPHENPQGDDFEAMPHQISKGQSVFPASQAMEPEAPESKDERDAMAIAAGELEQEGMLAIVGLAPKYLGRQPTEDPKKQTAASWMHFDSTAKRFRVTNKLQEAGVKERVNALFGSYSTQIAEATTEDEKLAEIARLVRALHVGHFFTDANGRLNVMLLMNRLLREEGLSPVILSDPALFGGSRSIERLVKEMKAGHNRFGSLVRKTDPSRDEIAAERERHSALMTRFAINKARAEAMGQEYIATDLAPGLRRRTPRLDPEREY